MKVWLDKCGKDQLDALQKFADKNKKLLCMRDKAGKLLAVGCSIEALQESKSKRGFKHYQVIKELRPIYLSKAELSETYKDQTKVEKIINDNFQVEHTIYKISIEIYEGRKIDPDPLFMKNENYWYKCYCYYSKYPSRFYKFDLINKKSTKIS